MSEILEIGSVAERVNVYEPAFEMSVVSTTRFGALIVMKEGFPEMA